MGEENPISYKFRWLDFKITNRCNNFCVYCGIKNDHPSAPEKLSFHIIKRTLDDAIEADFNYICLLGGEPSIREDIVDIINIVGKEPNLHLRLITNLKVFNEDMYKALFNTASGDAEIVASFENFSYPNYKRVKPQTSMKRIKLIKKFAKEYQVKFNNTKKRSVSLHSVISRENFCNIGEFVNYYYERNISISLGLVCPSIFTENPNKFNEFRKDEIQVVINQLNDLEKQGKLNFANKVFRDFLNIYTFGKFSHRLYCWAGKKQVIINSDGEVFPCISESYISSKRYGNIVNERFIDILNRFKNFICSMTPNSACWDHFLWDRLAKKIEEDEVN